MRVRVELAQGHVGIADVPSGRSTGSNEAFELRDGDARYRGLGVRTAIGHIAGEISSTLVNQSFGNQAELDSALIELDGTPNKSRLGGNSLAGVSLAAARAAALLHEQPLFRWLGPDSTVLPIPLVNLINGGKHASNDLAFQEIIVLPWGFESFAEALRASSEINLTLAEVLLPIYGKAALNTGDEGGFAPQISEPEVALDLIHQAVERAGYSDQCSYGLDVAATHIYDPETHEYSVAGRSMSTDELIDFYSDLAREFGVVTIEDPLHEEDFEGTAELTKRLGIQIVGDDLFVTNSERIEHAAALGAGNALLLKFNQIGTLTEALAAAETAERNGMQVVVSERSGETEDPLISDLVVGIGATQIKTGAPVRGERTSKYNRLLEIESELGDRAQYAGNLKIAGLTA